MSEILRKKYPREGVGKLQYVRATSLLIYINFTWNTGTLVNLQIINSCFQTTAEMKNSWTRDFKNLKPLKHFLVAL